MKPGSTSVTIDPTDQVIEENESNNTLTPKLGALKPVGMVAARARGSRTSPWHPSG
jgi:hypothetical protein